ncbi:preprotein translocase subunit YajC [candidate division KSB1 bacterium]|nr:preprotein translocase subunit YajC [candidate division KSB1 bacterium]
MAPQTEGQSGGGTSMMLIMMVAIFAIMYFLMIRPQQKKQKQHQQMIAALQKGDKVVTAGGIYGVIQGAREKDGVTILKVADNVKIEISSSSIARKVEQE